MELKDYEEVKIRFSKLIDLDTYFDYVLLSDEEFIEKYKYLGWSFNNFFEIRFDKEIDVLREIQNFKIWKEECLLIPVDQQKKVFKIKSKNIESFIVKNNLNSNDIILLNEETKWVLVKNSFNKLIGIGSYVIKRMKKNCYMTFGSTKILYSSTDLK